MRTIDLNVDLGEGGANDAALIALASSANIACGGHAGDDSTMHAAVNECIHRGVAIGAHPGYEDRGNFGRLPLTMTHREIKDSVRGQIDRLIRIAAAAGASIHHVKLHGALYNQAGRDPLLASAVAESVAEMLPGCAMYVPPNGSLLIAAQAAGLKVCPEGFVDRRYEEDGTLVPRETKGALIEEVETAVAQALEIALRQHVRTGSGSWIPLPARTLCVHGDGPEAVGLLRSVRRALEAEGFAIQA